MRFILNIRDKIYRGVFLRRLKLRDILNRIRYGKDAPKYLETIWIDPRECNMLLYAIRLPGVNKIAYSGQVVDFEWPTGRSEFLYPVLENYKIKACIEHWVNGKSWEETGIYQKMMHLIHMNGIQDGCKTYNDVKERYRNLDDVFLQISKERKVKTRKEVVRKSFREEGGPIIHIGPNGKLFFGGGGHHRFAIAYILGLPLPAQIGCVHYASINILPRLRQKQEA